MKDIPGVDGYLATPDGRIVSTRDGMRELMQRNDKGYMSVTLGVRINGKRERRRYSVHRLVCLAFNGQPADEQCHARHLNGNSLDNRFTNLAWGSAKENAADAIRHGTFGPGMKARRRKLTSAQVAEIRGRLRAGENDCALALEYGVSRYYPSKLAAGYRWTCLE